MYDPDEYEKKMRKYERQSEIVSNVALIFSIIACLIVILKAILK